MSNNTKKQLHENVQYEAQQAHQPKNLHMFVFPQNLLRSPYGMNRSVCRLSVVCLPSVCLSSVTFVLPAQRFELFANIFAPPNSSGTWEFVLKFLEKNPRVL